MVENFNVEHLKQKSCGKIKSINVADNNHNICTMRIGLKSNRPTNRSIEIIIESKYYQFIYARLLSKIGLGKYRYKIRNENKNSQYPHGNMFMSVWFSKIDDWAQLQFSNWDH